MPISKSSLCNTGRAGTVQDWFTKARNSSCVLPNNKNGSLRRFARLNKKLERQELTNQFAEIIEDQKKKGAVERADESSILRREFYIPPKPVRENRSGINKTSNCARRLSKSLLRRFVTKRLFAALTRPCRTNSGAC